MLVGAFNARMRKFTQANEKGGSALIILKQHFSAAEYSPPPAPTLTQTYTRDSSVELLCLAPEGYGGLVFKIFKVQQLIDQVEHSSKRQGAHFILRGKDTEKKNLYCCQYDHSRISSYMSPEPKVSVSPPPSPHLVVEPSSGHVIPGDTLSFHCQAPPDPQKQSPEAFLLLRRVRGNPGSMVAPAQLVSQSHEARFSVKTMGREDGGEYVCLYQLKSSKTGQVNSTASQPVHITVIELPVPTLSLSRHMGGVMECVGSPSYPQGFFYLFRVGVLSPEATHQASLTEHSARFPIPTHYERGAQYQCQYSVALGKSNAYSKMSSPVTIPCITGYHECTPTSTGSTDLALIIGSVSAGVLFLMVVGILCFAVHRHLKNMSERRRQRNQEKFWQHVHSRDHVADLTLQRLDIASEGSGQTLSGRPSFSEPIYDYPMATFKNPTLC
ncbi:alpha-1B-glycoprotein-like isoform X2 [Puntigrus tetrazona]|uniref:alpha-1B-glycoprotein-like isoform X2 n=1 Tax=Puntigrus tetrazona TaxID=1606681 RepID=UPI001C8984BA|nr:alpha-1B-glycoprotein-like isoform X2 [Puntigrus tetrazona]